MISDEAFQAEKTLFHSTETDRVRKSEFYDSTHEFALIQYFQFPDSVVARIMKDEANNWGFYLPNYQKWVEKAIHQVLKIEESYRKGYVPTSEE